MIVAGEGDLLTAEAEALVNTVNCVGVMGKGIALQFKRRYPNMFDEYKQACDRGEVQIGRMLVIPTGQLEGAKFIINFPTKKHWRSPSKLSYIDDGLVDLLRVIDELGIKTIAIPPLGAGNGGLDWPDVESRLVSAFGDAPKILAIVYAPTETTRRLAAPKGIRMTWGRALLLDLIRSYINRRQALEPWENPAGASHLEIQKLMYFADLFEPSLKLDFTPARYGPYSEKVRHILQEMEGAYTVGLGDGTAKTLANNPISMTKDGERDLEAYLQSKNGPHVADIVRAVLQVVEGFEGPYGIELLASTHWVASKHGACDHRAAAEAVRSWTERKGRIFTDDHVGTALKHLTEQTAIPGA
ncbi:macro domain-containing protein [Nocardia sp. NPDC052566]|uniref:type II toxin-antitoxin system antitoxin DNA ADP-ribosyl glycohydrolase DarG n=1 Tax=Nocardia sp. NPDC052566 TaxID=3364330 RepID=UPI0037C7602A